MAWYFLLASMAASAPPIAATPDSPTAIVTALYAPYLTTARNVPDSREAIERYASRDLRKAIEEDRRCEQREQGVCAVESDVIANGQDFELSDLKVTQPERSSDDAVVVARFVNLGTPLHVTYRFIKESGAWQIDEVEDETAKGGVWRLKQAIRDFQKEFPASR